MPIISAVRAKNEATKAIGNRKIALPRLTPKTRLKRNQWQASRPPVPYEARWVQSREDAAIRQPAASSDLRAFLRKSPNPFGNAFWKAIIESSYHEL
jgi:hypothetical protein